MIHISKEHLVHVPSYEVYKSDFPFVALDNRDEFDILCPVSAVTGHRTSIQDAILHLTEGNMELANLLIEELSSTYSDERLSVGERLDLCRERLSTGSFAENDAFIQSLGNFISLNYPEKKEIVDQVIEQKQEEVQTPDPEPKE